MSVQDFGFRTLGFAGLIRFERLVGLRALQGLQDWFRV